MDQKIGGILMACPLEVRNAIYRLLLVRNEPVPIRTPRKRTFKDLCLSEARGSILYVNREIHGEAIRIFFAYNTFIVGNGVCDGEASLTGLRAFTKFIPANLIASIPQIHLYVYLRTVQGLSQPQLGPRFDFRLLESISASDTTRTNSQEAPPVQLDFLDSVAIPFNSGNEFSIGSPSEALELRHIYQRIPKYFTGVTAVTVDWVESSEKVQIWPGRILPIAPTVTILSSTIAALMTLPKLKNIRIWEDNCVYVEHVLERILVRGAEMGKSIQFEHLRYNEGVSGRVRKGEREQREIHLSWRKNGA